MAALLNADHIEAIHSAMKAALGDYADAAKILERDHGWDGWDSQKLWQAVNKNSALRERWGTVQQSVERPMGAKSEETTSIYRPEIPSEPEVPESVEDLDLMKSLTDQEQAYREQLNKLGENASTVEFMVAAESLQSKFALCTLRSVTGGLIKSYNEIRAAEQETSDEIKELLAVEDPVAKALLIPREKVLRDYHIQLYELQMSAHDRITKSFYLQLEAEKLGKNRGNHGRPKKILGINAASGSNVAVHMGNNGD
jgi:hypothetical protein